MITRLDLLAFFLAYAATAKARDLSLRLTKVNATCTCPNDHCAQVNQTTSPLARCIDGTAPGYYWRDGVQEGVDKAILFLEGGGWCYPSEVLQSSGANCAYRAKSPLGSSSGFAPSIASMGYEGGSGYTSGDPNSTAWANWAAAYVKYCDGGSMTGTRVDPAPPRNGSGPLYYRGHYNLIAQLDNMVETKSVNRFSEIILSGCSAGGMACYLKCDFVAQYFAKYSVHVKCICDAGMFLDVPTVTGAGALASVAMRVICLHQQ